MAKKKRSRKKKVDNMAIHHDEQLEGALMQCMKTLKDYCGEGAIIVQAPSGKWKVLTFGGGNKDDNFHRVLGNVLAAGVMAIEDGPGDASEWTV
ncbi:hypothetical protein UFOVP340_51 [uncultured Caudovirales phage]|uniref:Uncharacterized protein n=1 Tax=uncultured Caudovirales phage TaxID=2100421 RepID=A0A6J5M1Z9_9CAUD|nr:hypothetical protein UFOVP340_51 [uncultured Caudovirales phage]